MQVTMKCAVYRGVDNLQVEDWPVPKVEDGKVLVKVAYCGMCGGDFRALAGQPPSAGYQVGHILGHEYTGVVEETGPGVSTLKEGDRVAGVGGSSCGRCVACRSGKAYLCTQGSRAEEGAFAEYTAVPETFLYPLPDHISLRTGALMEPLASAINTIDCSRIEIGSTVLIAGGGAIGLMMVQLAQRRGARLVIVSEPVPLKRILAEQFGAEATVDPLEEDLQAAVMEATNGQGVDTAIEVAGKVEATRQCIEAAKRGGTVLIHGGPFEEISLSPRGLLINKLLTLKGMKGLKIGKALDMLGTLDLEPLISEFSLRDINRAVDHIQAGRGVKAVIRP